MIRLLVCGAAVAAVAVLGRGEEPKPARFDYTVREDMFKALGGDDKALARGLKACDDALAKNPKHAEALVWRGVGTMREATKHFQNKDNGKGLNSWLQALREMDEAVKLEPKNLGVRIPRGVVYITASRQAPESQQKRLLAAAKEDMEFVLSQYPGEALKKVSDHRRGELLFALAEIARRTGDEETATKHLKQLSELTPDSRWGKDAKTWLADPKVKTRSCVGCHGGE
ncbi:hypothetical protein GobsT_08380 [Gemmata obscuriglobus]|uniref:Uncharacterized protein n=1 Tax=Gemmata obscuriglobus TaxID=114 RepID=A0A2Z3HCD6_9BACT|nr:hypothetical protein [Gemmata obscuriglobus]AWM40635.1 hypothetical protein C1280_29065 [Gemmata obscuriglobus]QEG26103.1 hypothetical protein GobsT_08380 [Gemmata obscuriglobus]VTS00592.1 hypothetical protein : [Gemmata obscuriglobus UQM 2246]